ncbi:MAG TPA: hypothetical protein VNE18_04845 [Rhodanobacter sp.]|nr:hypothetical protein [Rhodanobacter sp.]
MGIHMVDEKRISAVITMHGFYHGAEAITHYDHTYDLADYKALPYLYFALVMNRSGKEPVPVAGFFIKVRDNHLADDFGMLLYAAATTIFGQEQVSMWAPSIRPARLETTEEPLSEREMLRIMCERFLKNTPATQV